MQRFLSFIDEQVYATWKSYKGILARGAKDSVFGFYGLASYSWLSSTSPEYGGGAYMYRGSGALLTGRMVVSYGARPAVNFRRL